MPEDGEPFEIDEAGMRDLALTGHVFYRTDPDGTHHRIPQSEVHLVHGDRGSWDGVEHLKALPAGDLRFRFAASPPDLDVRDNLDALWVGTSGAALRIIHQSYPYAGDWTPTPEQQAGYEEAWRRLGDALLPAAERMTKVVRDFVPEPEALNRRRHGSASVCPKHGPTRGGLCRKCHR